MANLDFACGRGIDRDPIQPGGACFEPNTIASLMPSISSIKLLIKIQNFYCLNNKFKHQEA
jgi:hypothetical protein